MIISPVGGSYCGSLQPDTVCDFGGVRNSLKQIAWTATAAGRPIPSISEENQMFHQKQFKFQTAFSVCCLVLLLLISGFAQIASAQSEPGSATVAGTVLDQTGKAIQDAAVVVRNELTGSVVKTTTGADGRFSSTGLSVGT